MWGQWNALLFQRTLAPEQHDVVVHCHSGSRSLTMQVPDVSSASLK